MFDIGEEVYERAVLETRTVLRQHGSGDLR